MNRNNVICLASVVLLGFSSGCLDIVIGRESVRGSGSISEESHRFTELTGVELATMGELEIRLGDTEALQVSADSRQGRSSSSGCRAAETPRPRPSARTGSKSASAVPATCR
jgi:hypothetical protein